MSAIRAVAVAATIASLITLFACDSKAQDTVKLAKELCLRSMADGKAADASAYADCALKLEQLRKLEELSSIQRGLAAASPSIIKIIGRISSSPDTNEIEKPVIEATRPVVEALSVAMLTGNWEAVGKAGGEFALAAFEANQARSAKWKAEAEAQLVKDAAAEAARKNKNKK